MTSKKKPDGPESFSLAGSRMAVAEALLQHIESGGVMTTMNCLMTGKVRFVVLLAPNCPSPRLLDLTIMQITTVHPEPPLVS